MYPHGLDSVSDADILLTCVSSVSAWARQKAKERLSGNSETADGNETDS